MTDYRELTLDEWETEGRRLFGEDKHNWRFRCPACGMELSVNEAKQAYPEGKGWCPGQDCIGRYVDAVTCDWAAYGLFQGPWFVQFEDGHKTPCFPFAKPVDETLVKPVEKR